MSKINCRTYGDLIYSECLPFISKYFTPEISQNEFTSMFRNGILIYKNIKSTQAISLKNFPLSINNFSVNFMELTIPNDEERDDNIFKLRINGAKIELILSDFSENDIEKILIYERKKLLSKFMQFVIQKVEQKVNYLSIFEEAIKNIVSKIIGSIYIEINNLELVLKYNNYEFHFYIDKFCDKDNKNFTLNRISLSFLKNNELENNTNFELIENFDISINYTNNDKANIFDINFSQINISLNKNVYNGVISIINLINAFIYNKKTYRYKKLIEFHRPKKKNFLLYFYIKSLIKLKKFLKEQNKDIFDLLNSSQNKIIYNYLENIKELEDIDNLNSKENNLDNYLFLLPSKINLITETKEKVKEILIKEQKKGSIKKVFNLFFGGPVDEDNLSEEKEQILNEVYLKQNLINYLEGKIVNDKKEQNLFIKQVINFISNISITVILNKITLIETYTKSDKLILVLDKIKFNFNYFEENYDANISIKDVIQNSISVFHNKTLKNKDNVDDDSPILLTKERNNENKWILKFSSDKINITDELLFIVSNYAFYIVKLLSQNKIFIENEKKFENNNEDLDKNNISNFIIEEIPIISLVGYNLTIKLSDYFFSKSNIKFLITVRNNKVILYKNKIDIDLNKIINDREIIINEVIDLTIHENLLLNLYKAYFKIINNIKFYIECVNYNNYIDKKFIDFSKISLIKNKKNFSIKLDELNINLYIKEETTNYDNGTLNSSLDVSSINIKYENKNLDIKIEKIESKLNFLITDYSNFEDYSEFFFNYKVIMNDHKNFNDEDISEIQKILSDNTSTLINKITFKLEVFTFIFQINNELCLFNIEKIYNLPFNLKNDLIQIDFDTISSKFLNRINNKYKNEINENNNINEDNNKNDKIVFETKKKTSFYINLNEKYIELVFIAPNIYMTNNFIKFLIKNKLYLFLKMKFLKLNLKDIYLEINNHIFTGTFYLMLLVENTKNYISISINEPKLRKKSENIEEDDYYCISYKHKNLSAVIEKYNNDINNDPISSFKITFNDFDIKYSYNDIMNLINNINELQYLQNLIPKNKQNSTKFTCKLILEAAELSIIDSQPFLKFSINNLLLNIDTEKLIDNNINLEIKLESYNYLDCKWEPIIEKNSILINFDEKKEDKKNQIINIKKINVLIKEFVVNLSDMFITYLVLTYKKWIEKINQILNSTQKNNIYNQRLEKIITNKIINNSGSDMIIKFDNQNYEFKPNKIIELNCNLKKNKNNQNYITLTYEKNDAKNEYIISLNDVENKGYFINQNSFFISENLISSDNSFIKVLSIYSPVIITNKTSYLFEINLSNNSSLKNNYNLNSNNILSIPLEYFNYDNFEITIYINHNFGVKINYKEILEQDIIKCKESFMIKIDDSIKNIKNLILLPTFLLINCLPVDIGIRTKYSDIILSSNDSTNSIFFINDDKIELSIIQNNNNDVYSNTFSYNNLTKEKIITNIIPLENKVNNEKLLINLFFDEVSSDTKKFIIYAKNILINEISNESDHFLSNNKFNGNIYFLPNDLKVIEYFSNYKTKENSSIEIYSMISDHSLYEIQYKDIKNDLIYKYILKKTSFKIDDNSKLKINYYKLLPKCQIINLFSNKVIIFKKTNKKEEKKVLVPPNCIKLNFDFIDAINSNIFQIGIPNGLLQNNKEVNQYINLGPKKKYEMYTFCINENLFNLEIKKDYNYYISNIYISEATIDNCRILIQNSTDIEISLSQKCKKSLNQIIKPNETEILKIYKFYDEGHPLIYKIKIYNSILEYKFNLHGTIIQKFILNNKTIIIFKEENNDFKTKLTILQDTLLEKNIFIETVNKYSIVLDIKKIHISLIGDKDLLNNKPDEKHQRRELLLISIYNIYCDIIFFNTNTIENKKYLTLELGFKIDNLRVFNQLIPGNNKMKYLCVCNNEISKFFNLKIEMNIYESDKIIKINKCQFITEENVIFLSIDPCLILELIEFGENINNYINEKNHYSILKENKEITSNDEKKIEYLIIFDKITLLLTNIHIRLNGQNIFDLIKKMEVKINLNNKNIINIDSYEFKLNFVMNKLRIDNYKCGLEDLVNKICKHYSNRFILEMNGFDGIYKIIKDYIFSSKKMIAIRERRPKKFYGKYGYFTEFSNNKGKKNNK